MAIQSYITIDGYKYRVISSDYKRMMQPAKTVRRGVLGNTIVSIGPGNADRQTSEVLYVKYTPDSGYGSLVNLQAAMEKASVSYTDHDTDSGKWNAGTFNITLMSAEIDHLGSSPSPLTGYTVLIEWQRVL